MVQRSTAREAVTISRDELYQRVWNKPMSRLAAEFGISGNGLAKICDRLEVPYPSRGYWARKEAGQEVVQYRLPPRKDGIPDMVTITPTLSPRAIEPAVQEAIQSAREKAGDIAVPEALRRPHAIIAQWLDDRKERKRRARADRSPFSPAVPDWTESEHRQHRILDAIFRAVEKHGYAVRSERPEQFFFEYKTEKIECRLREKNRQVKRPKTAEEKRWSSYGDKDWTKVLEPTGNLVFTIEGWFRSEDAIRKEWLETETKRLESFVPEIVANILLAGPSLVKLREEREEQQRRYQEAERQRQIEHAKRKKDRNQWRAFVEQAELHDSAAKVRTLLGVLEASAGDAGLTIGDRSLADWLAWAKEHLAKYDPARRGRESIFDEISKVTDWTYRD